MSNSAMKSLFGVNKALIGMVHVEALPGTPNSSKSVPEIVEKAVEEAKQYEEAGYHGIILENMHDTPYLNGGVGPEITAAMAIVCREIWEEVKIPIGIQILAAANREALAVAKAGGAKFIRAEGFVFSHVADEGIIDSCAGDLLRYRKSIDAQDVKIFTDIKKKHSSHAITSDVGLLETAKAAEFFLSDGVIVTGSSTGTEASEDDLKALSASSLPVLVGSGITADNIERYFNHADGFIVGSWIKKDGLWSNDLDKKRVKELSDKFNSL